MTQPQPIIDLCNQALQSVQDQLPISLYQEIYDLINTYSEWGLGIEYIIDWIEESDLELDAHQFKRITAAMAAMGWQGNNRMIWLHQHYREQGTLAD